MAKTSNQFDYVLRGGSQGAERLRLLAAVKWPTTKTLLERVGVSPGMHCLDIGCGAGAVALCLADWVGPSGRVVGMDMDERCVELARAEARRLGLNAEFQSGSATEIQESSAFDLVFGRFVLTHLREPDKALLGMVRAARPGGLVVVEDIQFGGHFCYPACPAFDRYVTLYQQVVEKKGGDPNIGPRLLGMFLDAGLAEVNLEMVQPTYRQGPGKQIAAVTMEHIREAVVAAGLASNDEIDRIVADLESFAGNPRTMLSLPRIFQVWGKRPQS
jgi:ubiquinone/menaquinone biosynthesis C-methylase UbiE